ncbi:unnamed protein product [Umbelopsis ramanniana]
MNVKKRQRIHCIPLTPAAWSNWLTYEKPSQERQHQHNLILVSDPTQPVTANSDKENQQPQVQSNSLHLLCLTCHGRFIVSITSHLESDSGHVPAWTTRLTISTKTVPTLIAAVVATCK